MYKTAVFSYLEKQKCIVPWCELLLFHLLVCFLIYKIGTIVLFLSHEAEVRIK